MFQNSFQNGNYFQLYDPKTSQEKQKNLFKIVNISNLANTKIFDKQLKTYVLELRTSNAKIVFPKEDKKDLYLIQQFIVFQMYFFHAQPWSMELVISDLNKTKRRIMLSSTNNKLEIKPFFVKSPCANWKQGCWNNFAIDLYSFIDAFKGQTYRCLDSITIMGHFRLRRIYTTNMMPHCDSLEHDESVKQINLLPKGFYFPQEIQQASMLTRYNGQTLSQANLYEPTEPSTKNNSSYLKSTKNRMSTPKTQTTKSEKIVQVNNSVIGNNSTKIQKKQQERFLANTNGPEMLNRMRKRQKYVESSDSQSHITDNVKTPQSTQKADLKSKKKLIKTQIMPPKAKTSVQRRPKAINVQQKRQKQKLKSKLNPWRTNIKPHGQSSASKNHNKNESDLQQQSPKLINNNIKKSNTNNGFASSISKGFDRKSDHYSESQYIELSQKFSTLTDGKFFSRNNTNKNDPIIVEGGDRSLVERKNECLEENTEQIEENIQMESNSIYSPSNEKEYYNNNKRESFNNNGKRNNHQSKQSPERLPQLINQSICDSLDRKSPAKDFQQFGKQSYYGFADRLMNEYMKEKERPYSPPMREKLYTEEQQELNIEHQKQLDKDNKEVQLVYDPVLNCYYDHKTHTYYELKN